MSFVSQWMKRIGSTFGATSSESLTTEVNACLPVIETLEQQILDAAQKGTNATDELSASFGEMAAQAQNVVQQATGNSQQDSDAGVDQIREVLSELMAQVRETKSLDAPHGRQAYGSRRRPSGRRGMHRTNRGDRQSLANGIAQRADRSRTGPRTR